MDCGPPGSSVHGILQARILEPCCCCVASVVCDPIRPHRRQPTRLPRPWDSPGKYTGVGCHALLQGIFPTQGSNRGLPHCRWVLYRLSHQGSPTTVTLDHKSIADGLIQKGKESLVKQVPLGSVQGSSRSRTLVASYWLWQAKPQEL